ncbi:putative serine/threonine-protein kinase PkwA [Porphyridium purpureum]|uniref:Putative serine/threonine-protein kinase PkwA n=1 Tax=Porphyridium purpureum TaxID=35688 RepID=A0A5J4YS77_PORPP|nr:putative serine/threonine-protein kinase PkwA [Porphyridium purpureum]|eukprot:POR4448..scf229_5
MAADGTTTEVVLVRLLPDELWHDILRHVSAEDFVRAAAVSRRWRTYTKALQGEFWLRQLRQLVGWTLNEEVLERIHPADRKAAYVREYLMRKRYCTDVSEGGGSIAVLGGNNSTESTQMPRAFPYVAVPEVMRTLTEKGPPLGVSHTIFTDMAVSNTGHAVFCSSSIGTLKFAKLYIDDKGIQEQAGELAYRIPFCRRSHATGVALSPDNALLASASPYKLSVFDIEKDAEYARFDIDVVSLLTLGRTDSLAYTSNDAAVRIMNIFNKEKMSHGQMSEMQGHEDWVRCLASLSRDGSRIVSGADDRSWCVWDTSIASLQRRYEDAHQYMVRSVAACGPSLFASADICDIKLWDIRDSNPSLVSLKNNGPRNPASLALALSDTGSSLAVGYEASVFVFDTRNLSRAVNLLVMPTGSMSCRLEFTESALWICGTDFVTAWDLSTPVSFS